MSIKKFAAMMKKDFKDRAEERQYYRDKETREAEKNIRAESEAGMYAGPGPGQAQGRKMAERVKAKDKKNAEKYGGMDMPTTEQAKKMAYGGKAMKMAKGGSLPMVKKGGKMVPAFAADGVGKMSYGGKAMKMSDGKMVKKKKKTATVARRRGDGCAVRGKTKGRMV